jgi:hypothetical protein
VSREYARFYFGLTLALCVACSDPVHDAAVEALGPEDPGVPEGPLHRPGQPCLTCHGGLGPGEPTFSFAGTVYTSAEGGDAASHASVEIVTAAGDRYEAGVNAAGNFFVSPGDIAAVFPATTSVKSSLGDISMVTPMYRSGDCNDCHAREPGPDSPGFVYTLPPPE